MLRIDDYELIRTQHNLYKALARIINEKDSRKNIAREMAAIIQDLYIDTKHLERFNDLFEKLSKEHSVSIILEMIKLVQEYLNSSNFVFEGKYHTKKWFGGRIKSIYLDKNNEFTKDMNVFFDELYADYKMDQQDEKSNTVCRKNSKLSFTATVVTALSVFSSFQKLVSSQHAPLGPPDSFNYALHYSNRNLTWIDSFNDSFHYICNAPLPEVKYFFLGETHVDLNHHLAHKKFLEESSEDGDVFLKEGIASMKHFMCDSLCIGPGENLGEKGYVVTSQNPANCQNPLITKNLSCFGSDETTTLNSCVKAIGRFLDLDKKTNSIKTDLKNQAELTIQILKQMIDELKNIGNADYSLIPISTKFYDQINNIYQSFFVGIPSKEFDEVKQTFQHFKNDPSQTNFQTLTTNGIKFLEQINNLQDVTTKLWSESIKDRKEKCFSKEVKIKRNKDGIIATLENPIIKYSQHKINTLWGCRHYFTDQELNDPSTIVRNDVKPDDPQYELRVEYVKDKKACFSVPKSQP